VHPRAGWGSGTPSRVAAIEHVLRHIQAHEGVHFATLSDIHRWVSRSPSHYDEVRL